MVAVFTMVTGAVSAAGMNASVPVSVTSNYASGGLRDTRYEGSNNAYIYCRITGYATSTNIYVNCAARDSQGDSLSCYMYNPGDGILRALTSVSYASRIYFYKDAYSSKCAVITVYNGSHYL
jgi:GH24 family phage-related lysozyme (muramidase)